jgi:uncharacterized protein (TIGR04255 family)
MTIKPQHLSKAPIVEAIIGFTFEKSATDGNAIVERFYLAIQREYPTRLPITMAHMTVNEQGASGETQIVGARFSTLDGKRTCVIDRSSFLCSRLEPYETWESLKSEFQRLWELYSSLSDARPVKVGVRYINKIFLPEGKDMSQTIKTRPEIADGVPQNMISFFVRLEAKIPNPHGVLIITQAQLAPERPGFVTSVLDHDLQFPVESQATDIWAILEKARELKNYYFFASLSDETIKEYI